MDMENFSNLDNVVDSLPYEAAEGSDKKSIDVTGTD